MATVTELCVSCATATATLAPVSIGINVVSAAVAVSTTPTHPSIGYNAVSHAHAASTPTPSAEVTELVVSRAGASDASDSLHPELLTSAAVAAAVDDAYAVTTETPVEGAQASAIPADQLEAVQLVISKAKATSKAILDALTPPQSLWVNTKTMALATWEGPPVDAYALVGATLMASGDNLVRFTADDDAGTPIAARVVDDWRNFGSPHEKRYVSAYLSAKAAGPMLIGVETEENGAFTYQTHLDSSTKFVNHRAVFGKGLTGEYARLAFYNIDGKDFDVAALAIYAFDRPRRIGG